MKTAVEPSVSGIQPFQVHRKGRGSYRVKAKASYVDELLFGSHTDCQSKITEFDPPWVDKKASPQKPLLWSPEVAPWKLGNKPMQVPVPSGTPRRQTKYRLKSRTPSYCDEMLFSPKPGGQQWTTPRMTKEDIAKLRPLLWTPPTAPRDHMSLSSPLKETPLRAGHHSQGMENLRAEHREENSFRRPQSKSERRSPSLTRLYNGSDRGGGSVSKSRMSRQQDYHLPVASMAASGSPPRPWSKAASESPSARVLRVTSSCNSKPPWK